MRRRRALAESLSHEFELDLAPLLAVMVKLVPVLITSSAFVPVVVVQSQLPAPIVDAINNKQEDAPRLELKADPEHGFGLRLLRGEKVLDEAQLPAPSDWSKLGDLSKALYKMKLKEPQLFQLDLLPQGALNYKGIIKITDAARKIPEGSEKVKFTNTTNGTVEETDYMFPDLVFANTLEP